MEHFSSGLFNDFQNNIAGQNFQGVRNANVQTSANVAILELKPGEHFEGEIASVGGDEVVLKLANGQFLSARLEGDVQLAIGQLLAFQVQSNQNSKLVLKPVYIDQMQVKVGESALRTAGVAINEKNMQMVSSMIENGLSIDKNNIQMVYRQILQNPHQNIETIMQLNKLELPVNQANINQMESYQNMTYQIESAVDNISEEISNILEGLINNDLNQTAYRTFSNEEITGGVANGKIANEIPEEVHPVANGVQGAENISVDNEIKQHMDIPKSVIQVLKELVMVLDESVEPLENQSKSDAPNISPENGQLPKTVMQTDASNVERLEDNKVDLKEVLGKMAKDELSFSDLHDLITKGKLNQLPGDELKTLFASKEWKRFLHRNIQNNWSIEPEEVAEKDKVEQLYRKIQKQAAQMSEVLDEAVKGLDMKPKAVQSLQQNLNFMNQVNQIFQYVQLPVKLNNGQTHGDLYVYTNKKNLSQREGTVTAFLHLDMEHLGSVDAHVALEIEKNRLQIKFEVEDQEVLLILQHLPELNSKLEGLGYKVKTSASVKEQGKSFAQMLEESKGTTSTMLSYQKFDMRA